MVVKIGKHQVKARRCVGLSERGANLLKNDVFRDAKVDTSFQP
jgi:hypothetical protein